MTPGTDMQQGPSQSFEQELELLRERLQEAEEMHRAISHGEVDAFVVGPLQRRGQRRRRQVHQHRQAARLCRQIQARPAAA